MNTFDDVIKFDNQGKQGITGRSNDVVFKISKGINFLMSHENNIMSYLSYLRPFCPHFCTSINCKKKLVNNNFIDKSIKNPFDLSSSNYKFITDVLYMDYIQGIKLYDMIIGNFDNKENIIYSSIKQTIFALKIAQIKCKFVHYDLHSCNIIMKKCPDNSVFVYKLDDDNIFSVPTHGYYPVIIDYGFSYTDDIDYISSTLAYTEKGFLSSMYNNISDLKLFLVTISYELQLHCGDAVSVKFRNIVKNIYKDFKIDWESGWDNNNR